LVGAEVGFTVEAGDARLVGRVDRLERDRDGRLVVIDLKTGKNKPQTDEVAQHPQLGAYQLAVELGAFDQPSLTDPTAPTDPTMLTDPTAPSGAGEQVGVASVRSSGGARLVQLAARGPLEQRQQPLGDADDPGWVATQVAAVAARMRGSQCTSTINSYCSQCDVRACCPLSPGGGQVTG
jgi:RecB family exonuclease